MVQMIIAAVVGYFFGSLLRTTVFLDRGGAGWGISLGIAITSWLVAVLGFNDIRSNTTWCNRATRLGWKYIPLLRRRPFLWCETEGPEIVAPTFAHSTQEGAIIMLSNEEICNLVQTAFLPRRCVAEIRDYEHKLCFRVFDDQDKPVFTMEEVVLDSIRHESPLHDLCDQVKLRIMNPHDAK